ncbi:MAG: hypothetical protein NTX64_04890 [Elusimicrobia bacterium]|nr:hypothetical protein [Elusimicrobiota bacterium]
MRRPIFALTLALAACSILYELVLAQTLGALLGNTLLRYNVTIGLYLAALGAGALLAPRAEGGDPAGTLARIEWPLALLGGAGPMLFFLWDAAVFRAARAMGIAFRGFLYQAAIYGFDHAVIIAVGILSGFELPLLMRLAEREGPDPGAGSAVLAVDYAGTLLGAVCFPLLLLPRLGLLGTAAAAGLVNALCGAYLIIRRARGPSGGRLALAAATLGAACLAAAALAYNPSLERLASASFTLP